jgi:hypothetical protein
MSGMWNFADTVITSDEDPDLIDLEQGVPHLKGMRRALESLSAEEVTKLEAQYGATRAMPRAVEGKVRPPKSDPSDFMYDELGTNDVEFDAIKLSIHRHASRA